MFLKESEMINSFTKVSRLSCFRELSLGKNKFHMVDLLANGQDLPINLREQNQYQRSPTVSPRTTRYQPSPTQVLN